MSYYKIGERVFIVSVSSPGEVRGWRMVSDSYGVFVGIIYKVYMYVDKAVIEFPSYDILSMKHAPAYSQTINTVPKPINPLFSQGDKVFVITPNGSSNSVRPGKITNIFPPYGTITAYSYAVDLDTGGYVMAYEYNIVAQPTLIPAPPLVNYTGTLPDYKKPIPGIDWAEGYKPVSKKCECGSEKVGSSSHSSWCPKNS